MRWIRAGFVRLAERKFDNECPVSSGMSDDGFDPRRAGRGVPRLSAAENDRRSRKVRSSIRQIPENADFRTDRFSAGE